MMPRKMNKKTRNVISGVLVGIASLFAIINFSDMPAAEIKSFLLSTTIFFSAILLLALLAVCCFKLLGWVGKAIFDSGDENIEKPEEIQKEDRK